MTSLPLLLFSLSPELLPLPKSRTLLRTPALPPLFVGSPGRLGQIVTVVAEAVRQSLRKKGLHVPPWRKPEYMRAKWLSPQILRYCSGEEHKPPPTPVSLPSFSSELELLFDGSKTTPMNNAGAGAGEDVEAKKDHGGGFPVTMAPGGDGGGEQDEAAGAGAGGDGDRARRRALNRGEVTR
uniref:Uncharacterized protein n=1 Tax=Leersia perrieri TaxID=77586 RepID=A0A0D9VR79_9ORYZ